MTKLASPLYRNPDISLEQRVEDLLARMTLPEKLGQMMQLPAGDEHAESYIRRYHLGSYLHALGDDIVRLKNINAEQNRLGIPLIFGIDAIHGHCFEDGSTVFPVQLGLACSWNKDLIQEVGKITAKEAYGAGIDWTFSPVLCMARDPRWGRTSETFGEDSYLIGEFSSAMVAGYQNSDVPFAACAKHFAAYGESIGARDSGDAHISERNMRNVFLPPFERVAKQGCKTMMAAYQSLNGIPCSANTWLMNTVLREEWQYEGVVVTDWNNCGQIVTKQQAAPSIKQAVAACLAASNDIFMTTPEFFECALQLIEEGEVCEDRIDASVRRVLALKFSLGLFETQNLERSRSVYWQNNRWEVAEQASREALTLVKNDGVLPLAKGAAKKILLVGDNADNVVNQLGDWSFIPGMTAFEDQTTHRKNVVTLRQALEQEITCDVSYLGADVCGPLALSEPDEERILAACEGIDFIIFCAGDALRQYGEFHDRAELMLPGNQNKVFEVLCRSDLPVVSVLIMSKPHTVHRVLEASAAVLIGFNPGAKAGNALRDCLLGDYNPSGRLPISFPRTEGQLPVYYNQSPGWHAGMSPHYDPQTRYIDCDASPLLAFGQGMGYSQIDYGAASLHRSEVVSGEQAKVTLTLSNNSEREAVEVVQLYARWCINGVTSPLKNLIQYRRVALGAHECCEVELTVATGEIEVLNQKLSRETYRGELVLLVGRSSRDEDLQTLCLTIKN